MNDSGVKGKMVRSKTVRGNETQTITGGLTFDNPGNNSYFNRKTTVNLGVVSVYFKCYK